MSASASANPFEQHAGPMLALCTDALLKGIFESEHAVHLLTLTRPAEPGAAFASLLARVRQPDMADVVRRHALRVTPTLDGARAVTLAHQAAIDGRGAVACVAARSLGSASMTMSQVARLRGLGAGVLIVVEIGCDGGAGAMVDALAVSAGLPVVAPGSVEQVRGLVEPALDVSRAAQRPAVMVLHPQVVSGFATIEARPNRALDDADRVIVGRRPPKSASGSAGGDVLRLVRRMELNQARAMPSPGERVPVGFVSSGAAAAMLEHVLHLHGLGALAPRWVVTALHPFDDAAAERLLLRCESVVVVADGEDALMDAVLRCAEQVRQRGERAAMVRGVSGEGEEGAVVRGHPSRLAAALRDALASLRRGKAAGVSNEVMDVPPPDVVQAEPPVMRTLRGMVRDLDEWLVLGDFAGMEVGEVPPSRIAVAGRPALDAPRLVQVEIWMQMDLLDTGVAAVRQAARDERPWLMLVIEQGQRDHQDLERLLRGVIPGDHAERTHIVSANLSDRAAVRDQLREAAVRDDLTIVLLADGPPARYDRTSVEAGLREVDEAGFQARQRVVMPTDRACSIRPPDVERARQYRFERDPGELHTSARVDRLGGSEATRPRFSLRLRPLVEEAVVYRTQPPASQWRRATAQRLTVPTPRHGGAAQWRAYLAGIRSATSTERAGVATLIVALAGMRMGYEVRGMFDGRMTGPGRSAGAELLFTRPSAEPRPGLPALGSRAPFGEADVIIGLEPTRALASMDPNGAMRLASEATTLVVNTGDPTDELPAERDRNDEERTREKFRAHTWLNQALRTDVAALCRRWFHTDRVTDVVLLGAAYQFGLVPVSHEALEWAVGRMAQRGYGQLDTALHFGRRLAATEQASTRELPTASTSVDRLLRRMVLSLQRESWRGDRSADEFRRLVERAMTGMPGLAETEAGRLAERDMVLGAYRCQKWGGGSYAASYIDALLKLYAADRGDRGRALTRDAVLPLADSMLIRDGIYVATMTNSAEHRRRLREALNIKSARGDRLERRFLTRLDIVVFGGRLRMELRSSDWLMRILARLRRIVPQRWRGQARRRAVRAKMMDFVNHASHAAATQYDELSQAMRILHETSVAGRLRGMTEAQFDAIVGPRPTEVVSNESPAG